MCTGFVLSKGKFFEECHGSRYFIHPGVTKIYYDFREIYWWDCLERNITDFLSKCPNCQQVKAEHQRSSDLTQVMDVPT